MFWRSEKEGVQQLVRGKRPADAVDASALDRWVGSERLGVRSDSR
jgi:hypothetical protein